jgi:hypothetical protein
MDPGLLIDSRQMTFATDLQEALARQSYLADRALAVSLFLSLTLQLIARA